MKKIEDHEWPDTRIESGPFPTYEAQTIPEFTEDNFLFLIDKFNQLLEELEYQHTPLK